MPEVPPRDGKKNFFLILMFLSKILSYYSVLMNIQALPCSNFAKNSWISQSLYHSKIEGAHRVISYGRKHP